MDMYDLKLNETMEFTGKAIRVNIQRVPGGWNYIYSTSNGITSNFVPFDNSFQGALNDNISPPERQIPQVIKGETPSL